MSETATCDYLDELNAREDAEMEHASQSLSAYDTKPTELERILEDWKEDLATERELDPLPINPFQYVPNLHVDEGISHGMANGSPGGSTRRPNMPALQHPICGSKEVNMPQKLPDLIKASTAYLIVSKRIEVSKPTVYRWIDEERFGIPVKIGASVYVRRAAIEDYLDSLTADS